jgi:hypothetical protein
MLSETAVLKGWGFMKTVMNYRDSVCLFCRWRQQDCAAMSCDFMGVE